jgi:hypothetical protein
MGLDGAQRFFISFQAVEHDGTFEERNDEGRDPICINPWPDFPRFDSGADDRNDVPAPAAQGFTSALAQNNISVVGIGRRVEQGTAPRDGSAALNKIRNQLF